MEKTVFQSEKLTKAICGLALMLLLCGCLSETSPSGSHAATSRPMASGLMLGFDDVAVGHILPGWKIEGTRQQGPLATWQVQADSSAPSAKNVLAMSRPNHNSPGTYNLCWSDKPNFLNGDVSVQFKAVTGEEDQGGGVIWRAQDKDNYYIARFNPLEDNFRIYYVRDGVRRTLASVKVSLASGVWHTLKITQHGDQFTGYLNGKKLLEGSDSTFQNAGGVGLWTKADAVTSFDNFSVSMK